MFSIGPHFYPIYALANVVLLSPQGMNSILQNRTFYFLGSLVSFYYYYFFVGVMGQSNWLIAKKKNHEIELGRHLI
jgi:hypothetical protein